MFDIPIAMSMSDEYFMKITNMITTPCVFFPVGRCKHRGSDS